MGNTKSKIFNFIASLLLVVATTFGLVACSSNGWPWAETPVTPEANTDALGRLRISSVNLQYNDVPSTGVVNEDTGSFEWDLSYYYNASKSFKYTTHNDDGTTSESSYVGQLDSGVMSPSQYVSNAKFMSKGTYTTYKNSSVAPYDIPSDGWYTFDETKNSDNVVTSVTPVAYATLTIKAFNEILAKENQGKDTAVPAHQTKFSDPTLSNFYFSYYTISLSGVNYYIKVEVTDPDGIIFDLTNKYQFFSLAKDEQGNEKEPQDVFKISYQKAGESVTTWQEIQKDDYQMLKIEAVKDDYGTRFVMRYNPTLDRGSTSRYVRVQTNTVTAFEDVDSSERSSSALSSPITFSVYMLTFSTHAFSSTKDYNEIEYDKTKYYFAIDNQKTNSSLIGYFPAGKIVEVSRQIDRDSDYALQSWTDGAYASNTYVLSDYMPNNHGGYSLYGQSCLSSEAKKNGAFEITNYTAAEADAVILNTNNKTSKEAIEAKTIAEGDQTKELYVGTLSVVSCPNTASHVFYSNLAKVKNLVLAGTIYDMDSFNAATTNLKTSILTDVDIFIWQKKDSGDVLLGSYVNNSGTVKFNPAEPAYSTYLASMGQAITYSYVVSVNGDYILVDGEYVKDLNKALTHYSLTEDANGNYIYSETNKNYVVDTNKGAQHYSADGSAYVADDAGIYILVDDEYVVDQNKNMTHYTFNESASGTYIKINDNTYAVDQNKSMTHYVIVADNDTYFKATYENGSFRVNGLAYNCYLTFAKQADDSNYYSFNSPSMKPLNSADKNSAKALQLYENSDKICDRVGNTILSTKLETDDKVNINLYVSRGGTITDINNSEIKDRYQVISTTTSDTDELGNTTSRVIISLLLPANYSLTSYNVESLNSIGKAIYASENDEGYILCDIGQDESRNITRKYYYTTTKNIENASSVSTNGALSYLIYEGKMYQYASRDASGEVKYYYYSYVAQNDGDAYVQKTIKMAVALDSTTYTLYEYTPISVGTDNTCDATIETDIEDSDDVVAINYVINYNEKEYAFDSQTGSNIAVVATGYQIEDLFLEYETGETSTGQPIKTTVPVYVYYDVDTYLTRDSKGNTITEYYYTSPIGKYTVEFNDDFSVGNTKDIIYMPAFENYKDKVSGADIIANESEYHNFIQAAGGVSSLISNYYYYVNKLGEPTSLLISQSKSTDSKKVVDENQIIPFEFIEDENGDYIYDSSAKKYVKDATTTGVQHYRKEFYQGGNIQSRILAYHYGLVGMFGTIVSDGKINYDNRKIVVDFDTSLEKYIYHDITVSTDKTEANKVILSTDFENNGGRFKIQSADGDIISLSDSTESYAKDFIRQESENYVVQNINAVGTYQVDTDTTINYLKERKFYSDELAITVLYDFYIFSEDASSEGKTAMVRVYFDGAEFYVEAGNITIDNGKTYTALNKLTIENNSVSLPLNDSLSIKLLEERDGKWYVVAKNTIGSGSDAVDFYTYCLRKYRADFEKDHENDDIYKLNPTMLGDAYYALVGQIPQTNAAYQANIILNEAELGVCNADTYYFYTKNNVEKQLSVETKSISRPASSNAIVRRAQIKDNASVDVHLVGKMVLIDGEPIIYPSYDYYFETGKSSSILGELDNYYEIDYTTKDAVIQAFPGVSLISGAPYVNPIFYFEVKHKVNEKASLDFGLEIVDSYYVELITNAITSTQNNLIYDFATVSFKDTITNLTQNDYIDRLYYVMFAKDLSSVVGYTIEKQTIKDQNNEDVIVDVAVPYLNGNPLTIQNIGLNDNETQVYTADANESGKHFTKLYYQVDFADWDGSEAAGGKVVTDKNNNNTYFMPLNSDILVIWSSSATELETVPSFDIHSYYVDDNGLVVLSSDGKDNNLCTKVEDLFISGTGSTSTAYDYSEVIISGTTSAYRVNAQDINSISQQNLQAYTWDSAINISNRYNSTDAYFLCDKEGVVLVASPIVSIPDGEDSSIIYRFKKWVVYSRYNSEVLYLNKDVLQGNPDINNAIMRFVSPTAGYFVFMPVYERVYAINIATAVVDGANNLGGSVNVIYEEDIIRDTGAAISLENSNYDNAASLEDDGKHANSVYFVKFEKTEINGEDKYFYNNLQIKTFLYFTGKFYDQTGTSPIFEKIDLFKYGNNYFTYRDGSIVALRILTSYAEDVAGLIEVTANGPKYKFFMTRLNTIKGEVQSLKMEMLDNDTLYDANGKSTVAELLSYSYVVDYYDDGVDGSSVAQSKLAYYNSADFGFYAIDLEAIPTKEDGRKTVIDTDKFSSLQDLFVSRGTLFAHMIINKYNAISREITNTPLLGYDGNYYRSVSGSLSSGELYSYDIYAKDEQGNIIRDAQGNPVVEQTIINKDLQFKKAYFDRDTKVIISAAASVGYRLEGWYIANYNEITGKWIVGNTKLSDSINTTFEDAIINAYYNSNNQTWYYVTAIRSSETIDGKEYYTYYSDTAKTQEAVVPVNMLDAVRGYYYLAYTISGKKVYMPVYKANGTDTNGWYTNRELTIAFTGNVNDIVEMAHCDAVYALNSVSGDDSSATYYLGEKVVYKFGDHYYQTMTTGNVTFKDNKIYIENLHNEIRVVAKFIEVYQTMAFTEESSEDNIQVVAIYYDGVRTEGAEICKDTEVAGIETKYFKSSVGYTGIAFEDNSNPENYHVNDVNNLVVSGDYFSNITARDGSSLKKIVKVGDDAITEYLPNDLVFKNYKFDVNTDAYFVVRVHYDKQLNVHSLGMNSSNMLIPVIYPTDHFINVNMAAEESVRHEYYYYLFKVSFDRNLEFNTGKSYISTSLTGEAVYPEAYNPTPGLGNYNPEYLVHVNRGKTIPVDVMRGNYSSFYSKLFKMFDEEDNLIYNYDYDNGKVVLQKDYLIRIVNLLDSYKIPYDKAENEYKLEVTRDGNNNITKVEVIKKQPDSAVVSFANLREFFDILYQNFGIVEDVSYVIAKNDDLVRHLDINSGAAAIMNVINNYYNTARHTNLLTSGTTNFINLSTIPVYTFTTKIKVIDQFDEDGKPVLSDIGTEDNQIDLNVALVNKIYTRGGDQGRTYIGLARELGGSETIFDSVYSRIYADGSQSNNYIDGEIFNQDYTLAHNTIMVIEGLDSTNLKHLQNNNVNTADDIYYYYAESENGTRYVFKGWYEQKVIENTDDQLTPEEERSNSEKVWSDMQYMGRDLSRPFETTAYADTNIIALFECVVEFNINYDTDAVTINFNSQYDDLGNRIVENSYRTGYNELYFGITSELSMDVTPSGSYRFDSNWPITNADGDALSPDNFLDYATLSQDSKTSFAEFNYVKTLNARLNVYRVINSTNTANITINTAPIVLTYIRVEGYLKDGDNSESQKSGPEFVIYRDFGTEEPNLIKIIETNFVNGKVINALSEISDTLTKDDANRPINIDIELQNHALTIYGYFDFATNGTLYAGYKTSSATEGVKAWYVNANGHTDKDIGIARTENSLTADGLFRICYLYDEDNVTPTSTTQSISEFANNLNKIEYHLSEGNSTYLLTAVIESNSATTISYATVDTLEGFEDGKQFASEPTLFSAEDKGVISWTGKRNIIKSYVEPETDSQTEFEFGGETISVHVSEGHLVYESGNIAEGLYVEGITNYLYTYPELATIVGTTENGYSKFVESSDGSEIIATRYDFSSTTHITISNELEFYFDGENYYKFIGWFTRNTNNETYSMTMVSNTSTHTSNGGSFVAVFAKVAKVSEIYTETINAEGQAIENSKNSNGLINVNSNYFVGDFAIECYGELSYQANALAIPTNFTYAIIGSKITVNVIADTGYLVKAIEKVVESTHSNISDNTEAINELSADLVPDDETFEIRGIVTKGVKLRVVSIYYDSIAMNNVGSELTNNRVAVVDNGINKKTYDDGEFVAFYYEIGKVISLVASNIDLLGIIGFYINGEKLTATYNSTGTVATLTLADYTLNGDTTIEARFTNFVTVLSEAANEEISATGIKLKGISGATTTVEYVDFYTNETITITNGSKATVLSGMSVTLSSETKNNLAFLYWDSKTTGEGLDGNLVDQKISSQNTYSQLVEYKLTQQISVTNHYYAIYQTAYNISVEKIISSINKQDQGYYDGNMLDQLDMSKFDNAFIAMLDVEVTYTDIYGNLQTIILGTEKSLSQIKFKSGTKISVNAKIARSISDRYGWKIKEAAKSSIVENAAYNNENSTESKNYVITFYAKRLITVIRQVNNENSTENIPVSFYLENRDTNVYAIADNKYYVLGENKNVRSAVLPTAFQGTAFAFAGFYINGVYAGMGYDPNDTGVYKTIDILYGEQSNTERVFYSTATDLTVVVLYYERTVVVPYVILDGTNIADLSDTVKEDLALTFYGNRLTGIQEYDSEGYAQTRFDYTLQTYSTESGVAEYYQAEKNLALIASTHAGYQFVGFYIVDVSNISNLEDKDFESFMILDNKLDCEVNSDGKYTYGNTLTAIVNGSEIVTDSRGAVYDSQNGSPLYVISRGHTYYAIARYLTAYTTTVQATIYGQHPSPKEDMPLAESIVRVSAIKDKSKIVFNEISQSDIGIDVTATTSFAKSNNISYFYPSLSRLEDNYYLGVTVGTSTSKIYEKYEIEGIYVNGIKLNVIDTITTTNIQGTFESYVIEIPSEFVPIKTTGSTQYYDFNNLAIEVRYYETVELTVRLGINDTNDFNLIEDDLLNNIVVELSATNELYDIDETIVYDNNKAGSSSYYHIDSHSLLFRNSFPVGTTVSVTIYDKTISDKTAKPSVLNNDTPLLYNGWFMYANQSIAGSTTVINYTTNCTWNITQETDIVAQFKTIDTEHTIDQQYSFKFVGEEFNGEQIFTPQQSAGSLSDENIIANLLRARLLDLGNKEELTENNSFSSGDFSLKIKTEENSDNYIFNITYKGKTHRYLFTGWYQEVKGSSGKYLYVSNDLGLKYAEGEMPSQLKNAPNLRAEFVEIVTLRLNQTVAYDRTVQLNSLKIIYNGIYVDKCVHAINSEETISSINNDNIVDDDEIMKFVGIYPKLNQAGDIVITTLYNTVIYGSWQVINGYHSEHGDKMDSNVQNYRSIETTESIEQLENGKVAIEYLSGLEKAQIMKNNYVYTVSQTEMNVTKLTSEVTCSDENNQSNSYHKSAAGKIGGGISSFASASLGRGTSRLSDSNSGFTLVNNNIEIDDNFDDNKSASINVSINSPMADNTNAVVTIFVRKPDGSFAELIDEETGTNTFIIGKGSELADKLSKAISALPLGTVVSISIDTSSCDSEIIKAITLSLAGKEAAIENYNTNQTQVVLTITKDLFVTDIKVTTKNTDDGARLVYVSGTLPEDLFVENTTNYLYTMVSETKVYATPEESNQSYYIAKEIELNFEIVFANVFALTLTDNDINQGSVIVDYDIQKNTDTSRAVYNVDVSANDNYAPDNFAFSFQDDETAISTDILSILTAFTGETLTTNLSDQYAYILAHIDEFENIKENGWFVVADKIVVGEEEQDAISLIYGSLNSPLIKITLYAIFNQTVDAISNTYITSLKSEFSIKTSVSLEMKYAHVTFVKTYATTEEYSLADNATSTVVEEDGDGNQLIHTLYVFDYEFTTLGNISNQSGKKYYMVVNKLNTLYAAKLEDQAYEFEGYYNNGNKLALASEDNGSLVDNQLKIVGEETIYPNNALVIEAIFVHALSINFNYDRVDYDYGYLGTPTTNIKLVVDGEQSSIPNIVGTSIYLFLTDSKNISIIDTKDYYTFLNWTIKYAGNAIEFENGDEYVIDYSAVLLDANFVKVFVKNFKNSKTYAELSAEDKAALTIEDFSIVAQMKEEAAEISVKYDMAGEVFGVRIGGGEDYLTLSSTAGSISISSNKYVYIQIEEEATEENERDYRAVVAYSKSITAPATITLRAQSYVISSNSLVARTDLLADNQKAIRKIIATGSSVISPNGESKYLCINGFADIYGTLKYGSARNVLSLNTNGEIIRHSCEFTLNTTNLYLVEVSRAIASLPTEENARISIKAIVENSSKTQSGTSYMINTTDVASYAVVSELVAEGTIVNISVENPGNLAYSAAPLENGYNFRGFAISNSSNILMASDIYNLYKVNYTYSTELTLADWDAVLQIATSEDGVRSESPYYTTLCQYSDYNIPARATEYSFIASENTCIVADHIGLFVDRELYITSLISTDNATKFELASGSSNDSYGKNYNGENFVIVVASKDTPISFRKVKDYNTSVNNETITYLKPDSLDMTSLTFNGKDIVVRVENDDETNYLVYVSGELPVGLNVEEKTNYLYVTNKIYYVNNNQLIRVSSDDTCPNEAAYSESNSIITIVQKPVQYAIGIVNDKVITAKSTALEKYINNEIIPKTYIRSSDENQTSYTYRGVTLGVEYVNGLLKWTSGELPANFNLKKDESNYLYKEETRITAALFTDYKANNEINYQTNEPKVYPTEYFSYGLYDNIASNFKNPTDDIIAKYDSVKFIAKLENQGSYNFIGFAIVSETRKLSIVTNEQNLSSTSSIWTMKIVPSSYDSINDQHIISIDKYVSNMKLVALYQARVNVLNIIKKTYSEVDVNLNSDGTINPTDKTQDTNQGSVKTKPGDSLLVTSNTDHIELIMSGNGFNEFKGISAKEPKLNEKRDTLGAIYTTNADLSFDEINNLNEDGNWISENIDNVTDLYQQTYKQLDGSNYVAAGSIVTSRLFVSKYSTQRSDGSFVQNPNSVSKMIIYWPKRIGADGEAAARTDDTIVAYFTPVYYTINMTLSEIETGKGTTETGSSTSPNYYIAYSDEVRATPGWKNPSADANIGIADNDPYIYTWYDNGANTGSQVKLETPVRLTKNMIDWNSNDNNILYLAATGNTPLSGAPVRPYPGELNDLNIVDYQNWQDHYISTKITSIYDYISRVDGNYALKPGLFTITIGGESHDSGELTSASLFEDDENNQKFTMANISLGIVQASVTFDLSAKENVSIVISFKVYFQPTGMPDVTINDGQQIYKTDLNSVITFAAIGTIADLPEREFNSENLGYSQYIFSSGTTNGIVQDINNSGLQSELSGILFADLIAYDEELKTPVLNKELYPSLVVNTQVAFARSSTQAEAKLDVMLNGGSKSEVILTNPGQYKSLYKHAVDLYLADLYKNVGGTGSESDLDDNLKYGVIGYDGIKKESIYGWTGPYKSDILKMYENFVDAYDVYTIKNMYMYINAIADGAKSGRLLSSEATEYISELLGFSPTFEIPNFGESVKLSDGSVHEQIKARIDAYKAALNNHGSIFDHINKTRDDFAYILKKAGYPDLSTRILDTHSTDLTYTRHNVFENFVNDVAINFFGTSVTYGDGVVIATKLTEHIAPHTVEWDVFGNVWKEKARGYVFLNNTISDWGAFSAGDTNGRSFSIHHNNNYMLESADSATSMENTIVSGPAAVRWWSGITNRGAKYAGTYNIVSHVGLVGTPLEYTDINNTRYTAITTIHANEQITEEDSDEAAMLKLVKTCNLDIAHINLVTTIIVAVAGTAIAIAGVAFAIFTGGATAVVAGIAIAALGTFMATSAVLDGIMILTGNNNADNSVIAVWIDNLDLSW